MTTEITIIYKEHEIILELECHKAVAQTRHSPPEDAGYEILSAKYADGELLNDDEIEFIDENESDRIWDELADLSEYTREDYLLEKAEDDARSHSKFE